jgi:dipeptidyl-peptidase-3
MAAGTIANPTLVEHFQDWGVIRYRVPGFEELPLKQKIYIYYLTQAALSGHDIIFDQNCRMNLAIRKVLEQIYERFPDHGDANFIKLELYLKLVWCNSGIHEHCGENKMMPGFDAEWFNAQAADVALPEGVTLGEVSEALFDATKFAWRRNSQEADLVQASSVNYFGGGITQKQVEEFYEGMEARFPNSNLEFGLNSRVELVEGEVVEKTWKLGGVYSKAIGKIVENLTLAREFAENDKQQVVLDKLIEFYQTGDLQKWIDYSVAWIDDTSSLIDFVNGFVEVYNDPIQRKGSWEGLVNLRDLEAARRVEALAANAQWFEDRSPVSFRFRKEEVKGIVMKVITVAILAGDLYPSSPIGINLPNNEYIREHYGSKSVTLGNIMGALAEVAKENGQMFEFCVDPEIQEILKDHSMLLDSTKVHLHECLGHASGKLLPGVSRQSLGAFHSAIEEARADLFALYFIADPQMVKLGILPNAEIYRAVYYKYITDGAISQLALVPIGKNVEEAHMQNRKLVAEWALKNGGSCVRVVKVEGKTAIEIGDYAKLREVFGQLLAEIQRITSEGDLAAAGALIDEYATRVDPALHAEVHARFAALNQFKWKAFLNPKYDLVKDDGGNIIDVAISDEKSLVEQELRYSRDFSFL